MSDTRRISDKAIEYVEERKKDNESFPQAMDRVLGVEDPDEPVTREDVEKIFEEKLEDLVRELR